MNRLVAIFLAAPVIFIGGVTLAQPAPMEPATMEATTPVVMAPAAPAAAEMAAAPAETKPAAQSKDSKAAFWLTLLTPIILGIFTLLGGLGLMKWTADKRAQTIFAGIQTGVESFVKYSSGTDAEWDDAASKMIGDINKLLLALGQKEMSKAEEDKMKGAAEAAKNLAGPDKPADKPAEG